MRTKRVNFRIPFALYEELKKVAKDTGYNDCSSMLLGACVLLVQNERRKHWVKNLANSKPNDRDFMIEVMLSWPTGDKEMLEALKSWKNNSH